MLTNVAKIESQLVGSHDLTCHNTSTVLRLYSGSVLLRFLCFFPFFLCFLCFFAVFPLRFSLLLIGSSVFPLLSMFLCLVPLFSLYFLYLFLSTLSTSYRTYLQTVTFLVFTFFHRPNDLPPADRSYIGSRS